MIQKNTKIVFEGADAPSEELVGGIPLSKGEIVKIHLSGKVVEYVVKEKQIDCFMGEKDQTVNIIYTLKKK